MFPSLDLTWVPINIFWDSVDSFCFWSRIHGKEEKRRKEHRMENERRNDKTTEEQSREGNKTMFLQRSSSELVSRSIAKTIFKSCPGWFSDLVDQRSMRLLAPTAPQQILGWMIADRPNKCQQNLRTIIRNPFKHNLWLPSELPQITPKTPNDHQNMSPKWSKNVQHMHDYHFEVHELFMNNLQISSEFSWLVHGYSQIIYG